MANDHSEMKIYTLDKKKPGEKDRKVLILKKKKQEKRCKQEKQNAGQVSLFVTFAIKNPF